MGPKSLEWTSYSNHLIPNQEYSVILDLQFQENVKVPSDFREVGDGLFGCRNKQLNGRCEFSYISYLYLKLF